MTSKKEEKAVLDAIEKKEKRQECSADLQEKTLFKINSIKKEKPKIFFFKFAYAFSSLILVACIVFGILHFTNKPADDVHFNEDDLIKKTISINEIINYYNGNVEIRDFDILTVSLFTTKAEEISVYLEIKYKSNILIEENTLLPEDIYLIIILNEKYKYYKANEYEKCLTPLDITDGYYNEFLTSETEIEAMAYFDYQNKKYFISVNYMHFTQNPPQGSKIKDIVSQLIDNTSGEIHYGGSELINSSIDINNIKDYYSYNLTIEYFDINNVDLYSTEDDTPVYLNIKYAPIGEDVPGDIDLFIILNDNYTFFKSNYYFSECLNPLYGADGYYNETLSDEIMVTGEAYFSYQDFSCFITANYIQIEDFLPQGDIKIIVSQLIL